MKYSYHLPQILVLIFISLAMSCGGSDSGTPSGSTDIPTNIGAVGSSAGDLLSGTTFRSLEVEIQYATGFEPPQGSLDYLRSFLNGVVNKPGGINLTLKEIPTPNSDSYTLTELRNLEDDNREIFNTESSMAVYFFFADGAYASDNNVLGIAHRNTSMVLFQDRIEELTGGIGQASTELVTSAVLAHEMGHILGLVNLGSPMEDDHQDEANGNHCDVENCLMSFAINTSGGLQNLVGRGEPPALDSQCRADLVANGGK